MLRDRHLRIGTLLLLSANPPGTDHLRLDQEVRDIRDGLERARLRFQIEQRPAARQKDVLRATLDHKPVIVHFCGHGSGEDGLVFEADDGEVHLVRALALAEFFKIFKQHVRCVVLNACFSEVQARAIHQHIDFVIGMKKTIPDKAAIQYVVAFYEALGAGEEVAVAHQIGCMAILWANLKGHEIPELLERPQARPLILEEVPASPGIIGSPQTLWTVTHPRNPFFFGREDQLLRLRDHLAQEDPTPIAVVGLGGIGKTQLAVKYCHRHRQDYPGGVFWIHADSSAALMEAFDDLALRLGLATRKRQDSRELRAAVLDWLYQRDSWLVVFDNVNEPSELEPFWPTTGRGHILVTSRLSSLPGLGVGAVLRMGVLDPSESRSFLLRRVATRSFGEEEITGQATVDTLAEALGHLPLALEQAAAYLITNGVSFTDYLRGFQRHRLDLLERQKPLHGKYLETVASTWAVTLERVRRLSPAATDLLQATAFLAPEAIPEELVVQGAQHLSPALADLGGALNEGLALAELLAPLVGHSLIQRAQERRSFRVHRLLQESILCSLDDQALRRSLIGALEATNATFPLIDFDTWHDCTRLLPHAMSLTRHAREQALVSESLGRLCNQAGWFAYLRGYYREARTLLTQATDAWEGTLGSEDPRTLAAWDNLSIALLALGEATLARGHQERILAQAAETLGSGHPTTLRIMGNLGSTLRFLGDLEGARNFHEKVVNSLLETAEEDDPHLWEAQDALAETCRLQGDLDRALHLHRRILAARRLSLGPEHPDTLQSIHHMAVTLKDSGSPEEARELLEPLWEQRQNLLGSEHPNTLTTMSQLAEARRLLGDRQSARWLHETVLEARLRVFGSDHSQSLVAQHRLGLVLRDLGELQQARRLVETATQKAETTLGAGHPYTLIFRASLEPFFSVSNPAAQASPKTTSFKE